MSPEENLQIRHEPDELRLLFEVSQALEGGPEIGDHLDQALELMARYTGMMRGSVLLTDPSGQEIGLEASYGLSSNERERARYKLGEGITGQVIATGKPMVVPRVSQEPLFLNRTGSRDPLKGEISFICVPISVGGKVVGALSADRLFADNVHLEEDMRLLQVLAALIARSVRVRLDFHARQAAVLEENRRLQDIVRDQLDTGDLVGSSAALKSVLNEVRQVARVNTTVLLRGESGTGKELMAGIIHANSPRAGRPFVKINCAALPEGLVESELFGHERGAYTGATSARKGRFEMANTGTLFLDEVGDLTPLTQAKLLRAIQEKEFERVGGSQTIRVDVRLIAATNRDLEAMVKAGQFREDLFYRLSVFPLILPPLRERPEDIMALVGYFLDRASAANGRKILHVTDRAAELLLGYAWPGNIRELENVVERAVILCGPDGVLDVEHLPVWLRGEAQPAPELEGLDQALANLEKKLIVQALNESRGNIKKAAANLGISERVMGLRMRKHDLSYQVFRGS